MLAAQRCRSADERMQWNTMGASPGKPGHSQTKLSLISNEIQPRRCCPALAGSIGSVRSGGCWCRTGPNRRAASLATAAALSLMAPGCVDPDFTAGTVTADPASIVETGLEAAGSASQGSSAKASVPDSIQHYASPDPLQAARLKALGEITIRSRVQLGLPEVIDRVSELTGLQFIVLAGPENRVLAANGSGLADPVLPAQEAPIGSRPVAGYGLKERYRFNLRGSVPDVLDAVASRFGLDWEFDRSTVIFREFSTRVYQVAALPSRTEFSGSIGNSTSTGSIDLQADIAAAMHAIAGEEAVVTYGKSTGHFVVTARPEGQRRVERHVKALNGFLGGQIAFDVNVLTVALSESAGAGMELDLLVDGKQGAIDWTGTYGAAGSQASFNVGVLSGEVDLELFIGALDKRGRVTVETRTGITTSNNRMVPVQVINDTAYAKKVEAVAGPEGSTRTSIEPGTLKTGFELNLLPRLLPNRKILVSYSVKLSDLNELVEFTSDRQSIQLPRVSTTSFEQQAIIGDNQTLVLMGFERNRNSRDRSGGYGLAGVLGGRQASAAERIATVLMIRPSILPSGQSAGSTPDGKGADGAR